MDELDALRALVAELERLAREAYDYWDADEDSKVGKWLMAIQGRRGLQPELDAARDRVAQLRALGSRP